MKRLLTAKAQALSVCVGSLALLTCQCLPRVQAQARLRGVQLQAGRLLSPVEVPYVTPQAEGCQQGKALGAFQGTSCPPRANCPATQGAALLAPQAASPKQPDLGAHLTGSDIVQTPTGPVRVTTKTSSETTVEGVDFFYWRVRGCKQRLQALVFRHAAQWAAHWRRSPPPTGAHSRPSPPTQAGLWPALSRQLL